MHVSEEFREVYTEEWAVPKDILEGNQLTGARRLQNSGNQEESNGGQKERKAFYTMKDRPPGVEQEFIRPLKKPRGDG